MDQLHKIIPINQDRAITSSFFKDKSVLHVTSVFRTLQGEGPYTGYPSVFVRLAGCNFGAKTDSCSWCDTAFQIDKARVLDITALLLEVIEASKPGDIVVITGGEPTLQSHALTEFIIQLQFRNYTVQVETNGTQASWFKYVDRVGLDLHRLMVITSPKASLKTGRYTAPLDEVFRGTNYFKFVVSADPDSNQHKIPMWAPREKTYVSPMAVYARPYEGEVSSIWEDGLFDKVQTATNYAYAAQLALSKGYKLSLQTHLFTAIP